MRANRSSTTLAQCLDATVIAAALLLQCWAASGAERTPVNVYVCHREGVRMFADRPCSPDGQVEQIPIAAANEYSLSLPPDARTTSVSLPRKAVAADPQIAIRQRKIKMCRKLSDALERVHSQQRAGYRAKQGERLRDREIQLSQNLRREECR